MPKISSFDLEQAIAFAMEIEDYDDETEIWEAIEEKIHDYGIELLMKAVVEKLINSIDVGTSPLTGKRYKGFSDGVGWVAKVEIGEKTDAS